LPAKIDIQIQTIHIVYLKEYDLCQSDTDLRISTGQQNIGENNLIFSNYYINQVKVVIGFVRFPSDSYLQ
jgi:hypothetical protein